MTNLLKSLKMFAIFALSLHVSASAQTRPENPKMDRSTAEVILRNEFSKVPVAVNSIKMVICTDDKFNMWDGTAWLVAKDTYATAYHVTEKMFCTIDGVVIKRKLDEPDIDFTLISAPSYAAKPLQFSCEGFAEDKVYWGIGFPSDQMVVSRLIGTGQYASASSPSVMDKPSFLGMQYLTGYIFHGMSGGPIIDNAGVVVGINSATADPYVYGLSRELSDTSLCKDKTKA